MSPHETDDPLRSLVRVTVREMVAEVVADMLRAPTEPTGISTGAPAASTSVPATTPTSTTTLPAAPGAQYRTEQESRERVEKVRITTDAELDVFARHLLTLFENPKNRADLRTGRLRFRLQGTGALRGTDGPVRRVERGAVTERTVRAVAGTGERLVLARGAVLTPLARESARALGVEIEKEH